MAAKIIISGHSSGLGKALAELYLEQGCPVLGIARRMLPPREGLQQCTLDLSDSGTLARWLESGAPEAFINGADELVLINNAGTVAPSAVCGRQRPSEIAAAVALNVAAPLMLTNHVLAVRPESLPVKIIHISSGAGRKAYPGWSVYGATKAALDHHARCVAAEDRRNVAALRRAWWIRRCRRKYAACRRTNFRCCRVLCSSGGRTDWLRPNRPPR